MTNPSCRFRSHLTEEQLIRFLDGELGKRDRASAERHMESCWGCRRRLEQFRLAMDRFVEFDAFLAEDSAASPPNDWNGFSWGLRGIASATEVPPAPALTLRRAGVLAPAVVLCASFAVLWLAPVSTVSAKEIYERSTASEQALLGRTQNPLVIQQVRVESNQRTALWSLWRAPSLGRIHESWDSRNDPDLRAEVEKLYAEHGLDFSQPLSVSNHSKWRRSLGNSEDSVRTEGDLLRVMTRNQGQAGAGQIVEAEVVVRTSDWHPVEASFRVSAADGEKQYRMIEASYRVESINAESARVFEPPTLLDGAQPVVPALTAEPAVDPPAIAAIASPAPDPVRTEIEALARLHEIGSDRRDSAQVEREGSVVRVTAYAENADRRGAIEGSLAGLPGIVVAIHLLSDPQPAESTGVSVPVAVAAPVPPLFLKALDDQAGSAAAANALVSRQMNLLWELTVESGTAEDLARRFPDTALESPKLDALALDHLAAASRAWAALESASGRMLAAMGVPAATSESGESLPCGDWRSRSLSSAGAARRLAGLYARAFTVSAGAPNDQISEESVRTEVPALRTELARAFPQGCFSGVN